MATDYTLSDTNTSILLNTLDFLANKIKIGEANTSSFMTQIQNNTFSVEKNQIILQDIKDAIETKNNEYLQREKDINKNGVPNTMTLQDWSLALLYSGVGLFSFLFLVYIFIPANNVPNAFLLGVGYVLLLSILFICGVFIIQRYA